MDAAYAGSRRFCCRAPNGSLLLKSNISKLLLLVEDLDDDAFFFERAFGQAGLQNPIVRVATGSEAVLYLTGEGRFFDRTQFPFPSVMFLDLGLPHIQGLDVLESVRAHYSRSQLLIVVLTGGLDSAVTRKAYALGADSCLVKPPRPDELRDLAASFPDHFFHHEIIRG